MDSSKPACATFFEDSTMVISKRDRFYAKYYQQNFSMPNSIIFYIAKNPKTAGFYLKMVKTCKYFFIKNKIIIIQNLDAGDGEWRSGNVALNFTKYNCKYWITDKIKASGLGFVGKNIFSPIIPRLYQCDVKCLFLSDQIISYNDLSLLISSAERIGFIDVFAKYADSSDVQLEDIVAIAIKAYEISVIKPTITSKTMKELTKLANFTKLDNLNLHNLSEVFDIDAFYCYMKKNQQTKLHISFDEQISEGYMNRLETIVDEILETKQFNYKLVAEILGTNQFDYKPPFIGFTGLDIQKFRKLCQIFFY
uniref:Uncharacterized protein n=1 Tax=Panagrolaimus davidi TaxID=227884 RepID=A0A914QGA8_9BILA